MKTLDFFRSKPSEKLSEILENGAVLVDVRSEEEFAQGSVFGSLNIPLDTLHDNLQLLNVDNPIVVYCLSGSRSERAVRYLNQSGFKNVVNGYSWTNVSELMDSLNPRVE